MRLFKLEFIQMYTEGVSLLVKDLQTVYKISVSTINNNSEKLLI